MNMILLFAGKMALWKHNVYGLSPSVASAHHLLVSMASESSTRLINSFAASFLQIFIVAVHLQSYAKDHKDAQLMVEIMKLVKRNDLPLQPGTADIVFRYVGVRATTSS